MKISSEEMRRVTKLHNRLMFKVKTGQYKYLGLYYSSRAKSIIFSQELKNKFNPDTI